MPKDPELTPRHLTEAARLERHLHTYLVHDTPGYAPPEQYGLGRTDSHSKNQPSLHTRAALLHLTGVDLVAVHEISASLAQAILSEIGTDMSKWPSEKHFCSWLGLAPHTDIAGGKILRSQTLKTDNWAGQAFRQAAASVWAGWLANTLRQLHKHFGILLGNSQ